MQKPRASRFGEILFSVRGTPVMNTVTAANMLEAKKHDAIVQNVIIYLLSNNPKFFQLLHQEDTMLTPETRKVIGKLKELVQKRAGDDKWWLNAMENKKIFADVAFKTTIEYRNNLFFFLVYIVNLFKMKK